MVRTRRIELPLPRGNRLLRPARLPVPPRPRANIDNTNSTAEIQDWPKHLLYLTEMTSDVAHNLSKVRARMAAAAERAGRDAAEIKLVAVSKTHPASVVRDAIAAGAVVLGENKVQEAESKIAEIGRGAAEWHLIGHLQSNKARRAVQLFDVIHSVDSLELAQRLERICIEEDRDKLSVFVHVDFAGEETKSGVSTDDLAAIVDFLKGCKCVRFRGLMILPPFLFTATLLFWGWETEMLLPAISMALVLESARAIPWRKGR